MADHSPNLLRQLPAVAAVLALTEAQPLVARHGRLATTDAIRQAIETARVNLRDALGPAPTPIAFVERAQRLLDAERSTLRPVFNLTGIVIHTNLGRVLLAEEAIAAAVDAMRQPVSLEYELDDGERGERDDHLRCLLCTLTGAEDATVVNNNAAAVLLCVNTLALARDAIVSRGELIEIGGAFRMPDIVARAGARLVEVGTTNRTHASDYRDAIGAQTGVLLKVHPSNYRVQGFTADVPAHELMSIAQAAAIPLVNDLGSGSLIDLSSLGLKREPTVREAVAAGADLVTFSGDKLLGGPQAGFIVGRRSLIEAINRNPLKRALRLDKIRLAAMLATLSLYRDPDRLAERLPTLRLLARGQHEIDAQAKRLLPSVARILGGDYSITAGACLSQTGSGSLPLDTLESTALVVHAHAGQRALEHLAKALRGLARPVLGRIADGALRLDLRCLAIDEEGEFLDVLSNLRDASTS